MRIVEEIIKNVSRFYIQETAQAHKQRTGISPSVSHCTLGEFKDGIYKGAYSFQDLQSAQQHLEEIKSKFKEQGFVPNKRHSQLQAA